MFRLYGWLCVYLCVQLRRRWHRCTILFASYCSLKYGIKYAIFAWLILVCRFVVVVCVKLSSVCCFIKILCGKIWWVKRKKKEAKTTICRLRVVDCILYKCVFLQLDWSPRFPFTLVICKHGMCRCADVRVKAWTNAILLLVLFFVHFKWLRIIVARALRSTIVTIAHTLQETHYVFIYVIRCTRADNMWCVRTLSGDVAAREDTRMSSVMCVQTWYRVKT